MTDLNCARILSENYNRFECPDPAVVIYELPDGTRAGFCERHRREADHHAQVRGWTLEQELVTA